MRSKIITVSGPPGSGTSTVSRQVANELGYSRFSSGDFMRNIAREKNLSLGEINEKAEDNPAIDRRVDKKIEDLADSSEVVIDSRMAFHLIPDSFAVYLEVGLDTAANRIYDERHERAETSELTSSSVEETKQKIIERLVSERQRYRGLYDTVHTNHRHYDLVIDTEKKGISGVVNTVISVYQDWLAEELEAKREQEEGVAININR